MGFPLRKAFEIGGAHFLRKARADRSTPFADVGFKAHYKNGLNRPILSLPCLRTCSRSVARGLSAGRRAAQKPEFTWCGEDFEQRMSPDHKLAVRS